MLLVLIVVDDVSEQDFWPKLWKHILPQIKVMLLAERPNAESIAKAGICVENESQADLDGILFKGDRMYRHKVLRINYTMYDV